MRVKAMVLVFGAVLAVGACGSSDKTTSGSESTTTTADAPTTTVAGGKAARCAQVENVKSAVDALKDVKPIQDGVAGVQTAADNVKSSVKELASVDVPP